MKNFTYTLNASILSLALVAFVGCSKDEIYDIETSENAKVETVAKTTSGGSCSGAVNFSDLDVETSWISGDKDDRDQFGACGVDGEAWMDRYNDGRVMMKCLKQDGQRTELKEDNGDEDNLTSYKKMVFTAKFSSLPSHGVTIAQVHNRASGIKRPWLRLYIDSDGKFKIKRTNTTPTASTSTYTTFTGMTYTSNQDVTITVWTGIGGAEKAKIRVDYNGARFDKHLSPSSSWNNYDDHFYLKAGVYTEGADKEAKVTYSSFSINH